MTAQQVILAVDAGTTGTRAAWVTSEGDVGGVSYRKLSTVSPAPGVVTQDATEILHKTVRVLRSAYASAQQQGFGVMGVAFAAQRSTAILWDTETEEPLVPSMVWQDSRHASDLVLLSNTWDERLWGSVGRPVGTRSPYLWAATIMNDPAQERVRESYRRGRLGFGTVDTWLLWSLSTTATRMTTATQAVSAGAYELGANRYFEPYLEELGFPLDLLPELRDDVADFGRLRAEVLGEPLPILASVGDQQAAVVGLGAVESGDSGCVHGTGSFLDLNVGTRLPENRGDYPGVYSLVAWRDRGVSHYSLESFSATTGAAVEWMVRELRVFDSAEELSALAARGRRTSAYSLAAFAGIRMPRVHSGVGAVIGGLSLDTTREDVALAVLEGIAQSAAWSIDANQEVGRLRSDKVIVGGGVSNSDALIQLQADLTGVPHYRFSDAEKASLRGAAFLGGVAAGMWASLEATRELRDAPAVFEPSLSVDQRQERLSRWRRRVRMEMELSKTESDDVRTEDR